MLIGYARVSTSDQENTMQIDALKVAGVKKIYHEKASGVSQRLELQHCISQLKPGSVLVVWKLDRLARSLRDLLTILERLKKAGCAFRSLTEPVDTSTPIGEFLVQVLGAVAQLERSIIRERVIAGQVAAISRGGTHGRPSSLLPGQDQAILKMWSQGKKKADICRLVGHSRWVIDRVIFQHDTPNHHKYGPHRPVLGPLLTRAVK